MKDKYPMKEKKKKKKKNLVAKVSGKKRYQKPLYVFFQVKVKPVS